MSARPQTALGAALVRAGMNVTKTRLYQLALDTLRKHKGTKDRGFDVFENAVEDDPDLIREALLFYYARIDSDMSGGHTADVLQSITAASTANGTGPARTVTLPSHARPVREPSALDRAAAGKIAQTVALTAFDSFKVRDGRGIGDVRFGELKRMMTTNAREAAVIRQILDHGDSPHDMQVRQVIKRADLERMIQRAAEIVDAAR
jgi:hypothetical protein